MRGALARVADIHYFRIDIGMASVRAWPTSFALHGSSATRVAEGNAGMIVQCRSRHLRIGPRQYDQLRMSRVIRPSQVSS